MSVILAFKTQPFQCRNTLLLRSKQLDVRHLHSSAMALAPHILNTIDAKLKPSNRRCVPMLRACAGHGTRIANAAIIQVDD